jgi:scavenger receptor class B, member 1
MDFVGEESTFGMRAYRFIPSKNAFHDHHDDPDTKCFCESKTKCLRKGLGNIGTCFLGLLEFKLTWLCDSNVFFILGLPIATSEPYLLNSDPSYFDGIEGLKPDKDKHQTFALVQPVNR